MKRPIFFNSFFSTKFSGSKFLPSAAIWQAKLETSNCVMRETPLLPASRFFHVSSVVLPTPQIRPMPVTTTRRPKTTFHLSHVCRCNLLHPGPCEFSQHLRRVFRHQRPLRRPSPVLPGPESPPQDRRQKMLSA